MRTAHSLLILAACAGTASSQVTWTAADNPHIISGDFTVPAGATLTVEPGVHIHVNAGSNLNLFGTLRGHATAADPISITSDSNYSSLINVKTGGTLDLDHADVDCQVQTERWPSTMLFNHCTFHGNGYVTAGTYFDVRNSHFDVAPAIGERVVKLENISSSVPLEVPAALAFLDNITVNNTGGHGFTAGGNLQPTYVDGITATGNTGSGLFIWGGNVSIGPSCTLQNNEYPVSGGYGSGLWPDSHVPLTGNRNNALLLQPSTWISDTYWPSLGLPYIITGGTHDLTLGGPIILPGVTVKMAPNAAVINSYGSWSVHGTRENPIRFERLDPAQAWDEILYNRSGMSISHAVIDGSIHGIRSGQFAGPAANNCTFTNNFTGVTGTWRIRGCTFEGNQYGVSTDSASTDVSGQANPNSFTGNGVAIYSTAGCAPAIDARGNWWGSPTGPSGSVNPGGSGQPVQGCATVAPFRTTPPTSDEPPRVKVQLPWGAHPGARIMIVWTADDDVGIVSQRIDLDPTGVGFSYPVQLAADLPGNARAFEWVVPVTPNDAGGYPAIRITARDTAGQEDYGTMSLAVDSSDNPGQVTFTSPAQGSTYQPQQDVDMRWNATTFPYPYSSGDLWLMLDNDGRNIYSLGSGRLADGQGFSDPPAPALSTDRVRIGFLVQIANRQHWYFGKPFAIRPDSRVGHAPPAVAITSPSPSTSFTAGSTIPIAWTASDDESLRSFDVMASYDDGDDWQVIASDLPPTATSYNWSTASGQGMPIRLRIVARDLRFQNSSSETTLVLAPGAACYANCDNSTSPPILNANDFQCFLNQYAAGNPAANCDNSTAPPTLNANDFQCFLNRFAAGCM